MYTKQYIHLLLILVTNVLMSSCKKLVAIDAPADTVATKQVFAGNKEADWAVSALYSKMINGFTPDLITLTGKRIFPQAFAPSLVDFPPMNCALP